MRLLAFSKKYWLVIGIAIIFTALAIMAAVYRFNHYETGTLDLGIFVAGIKNTVYGILSPGGFPLYNNFGGMSQLSAHFSPILFLLVPLYKIWESPITLLVVQAIMIGIGGLEIYYLARSIFKLSHKISIFVEIVFFVNPLVWSMLIFDFHEICFAVPLVLLMIIGYFKKNWWLFGIGLMFALMVKEDIIVTIGILGLSLLVFDWFHEKAHKVNKFAIVMIVGTIVAGITAFIVSIVTSENLPPQILNFLTERYTSGTGNATIWETVFWYIRHVTDIYSIGQVFSYFAPFCFMLFVCGKSRIWLVPVIPVLGMVMITTWTGQHTFIDQYGVTAIPFLFTAFLITLTQKNIEIEKNWGWIATGIGISLVIIFLFTNLTRINQLIAPSKNSEVAVACGDLNKIIDSIPNGKDCNSISVTGNNWVYPHIVKDYNAYTVETPYGISTSIWGYPHTITDYVITDTNVLMSQVFTKTLISKETFNWDELESQALSQDSRYELIDSVNGAELWKLK